MVLHLHLFHLIFYYLFYALMVRPCQHACCCSGGDHYLHIFLLSEDTKMLFSLLFACKTPWHFSIHIFLTFIWSFYVCIYFISLLLFFNINLLTLFLSHCFKLFLATKLASFQSPNNIKNNTWFLFAYQMQSWIKHCWKTEYKPSV